MKVDIDCRRFPNFKEIVLVYLQSRKALAPFDGEFSPEFKK